MIKEACLSIKARMKSMKKEEKEAKRSLLKMLEWKKSQKEGNQEGRQAKGSLSVLTLEGNEERRREIC